MSPSDSRKAVNVVELIGDLFTEQPSCASWTHGPCLYILWVAPHEIAEGSFVGNFLGSRNHANLIYGSDLGTETTVNTEDGAIHNSGENKEVKHLTAGFPDGGVTVLLLTLLVEPINLGDLS